MTRRHFLQHGAALAGAALSGCDVGGASAKRHISRFGQTFEYLKDAQLRQQEKGDALITVEGAEISGAGLQGMEWRNILFKRCDFVGAYELKPKTAANVRFEDCRFSGIFSFGVATDIQFLRCGWTSESILCQKRQSWGDF